MSKSIINTGSLNICRKSKLGNRCHNILITQTMPQKFQVFRLQTYLKFNLLVSELFQFVWIVKILTLIQLFACLVPEDPS